MCNCRKRANQQYEVRYPDGTKAVKPSQVAAKLAAAAVAGATYVPLNG